MVTVPLTFCCLVVQTFTTEFPRDHPEVVSSLYVLFNRDDMCQLEWIEFCGPTVKPPKSLMDTNGGGAGVGPGSKRRQGHAAGGAGGGAGASYHKL